MEKGEAVKKPLLENYNGQGSEISSSTPLTIVVGFSCIVVYCSSFAGGNSVITNSFTFVEESIDGTGSIHHLRVY